MLIETQFLVNRVSGVLQSITGAKEKKLSENPVDGKENRLISMRANQKGPKCNMAAFIEKINKNKSKYMNFQRI